jgi:transcriptional regulator with PAS, ATPase and Fis domain
VIHELSRRRNGTFVAINCAALGLVERKLFRPDLYYRLGSVEEVRK